MGIRQDRKMKPLELESCEMKLKGMEANIVDDGFQFRSEYKFREKRRRSDAIS
jgi:hypothetical protein